MTPRRAIFLVARRRPGGSGRDTEPTLTAYLRAWKKNPTPFVWTKPAHAIIRSHQRMLERISTAVH
jgi:hypothetical protein